MQLRKARVRMFKSIQDSGEVRFDSSGVTTLVGKNESGKTAFFEALYRLNPLPTGHSTTFDVLRDHPRAAPRPDDLEQVRPVEATFELTEDEVTEIEERFGVGVMTSREVRVGCDYTNRKWYTFFTDDAPVIRKLLNDAGVDHALAGDAVRVADLRDRLEAMDEKPPAVEELLDQLDGFDYRTELMNNYLNLPKFLYFDEYSQLPGRVSIARLQSVPEGTLDAGERTALALLRLAGAATESFAEAEYEARKASLEWAANQITDEVFAYWSQNRDLAVEFDVDQRRDPATNQPAPVLEIRIRNHRHRVSLNFDERSRGFVWFFSFVAAFSEFRRSKEDIVLLLDEPGLGLHAAAQGDLLRYIDERLASERDVVYTTHSPFMVDPAKLDRARTVEDVDGEGTKIRNDVLAATPETLFPLQAALGYELAQTLFVGPDNLVVEGPADLIYLQVMSDHLRSLGRTSLDGRWVIVPVGGLDKVPTFIALLGSQLNLAVVMDVGAGGSQRINALARDKVISDKKLIPLTDVTGTNEADIEDLFEPSFYVKLLKGAGVGAVKTSDLKGSDRLVKRVERALGAPFSHYRPARYLLENQGNLLGSLSDDTLAKFEELFDMINQRLS